MAVLNEPIIRQTPPLIIPIYSLKNVKIVFSSSCIMLDMTY
jgi:hypothetical protein